MWKNINKLISLKNYKENTIKQIIKDDGSIKNDLVEISNALNDSFISTGLQISSRIKEPGQEIKTKMKELILTQKNSI